MRSVSWYQNPCMSFLFRLSHSSLKLASPAVTWNSLSNSSGSPVVRITHPLVLLYPSYGVLYCHPLAAYPPVLRFLFLCKLAFPWLLVGLHGYDPGIHLLDSHVSQIREHLYLLVLGVLSVAAHPGSQDSQIRWVVLYHGEVVRASGRRLACIHRQSLLVGNHPGCCA